MSNIELRVSFNPSSNPMTGPRSLLLFPQIYKFVIWLCTTPPYQNGMASLIKLPPHCQARAELLPVEEQWNSCVWAVPCQAPGLRRHDAQDCSNNNTWFNNKYRQIQQDSRSNQGKENELIIKALCTYTMKKLPFLHLEGYSTRIDCIIFVGINGYWNLRQVARAESQKYRGPLPCLESVNIDIEPTMGLPKKPTFLEVFFYGK